MAIASNDTDSETTLGQGHRGASSFRMREEQDDVQSVNLLDDDYDDSSVNTASPPQEAVTVTRPTRKRRNWIEESRMRKRAQNMSASSMQLPVQLPVPVPVQLQSPHTRTQSLATIPLTLLVIPPLMLLFTTWRHQLEQSEESEMQRLRREVARCQQQHQNLKAKYKKIQSRFYRYVQDHPFQQQQQH
jgi:hypothetical protein